MWTCTSSISLTAAMCSQIPPGFCRYMRMDFGRTLRPSTHCQSSLQQLEHRRSNQLGRAVAHQLNLSTHGRSLPQTQRPMPSSWLRHSGAIRGWLTRFLWGSILSIQVGLPQPLVSVIGVAPLESQRREGCSAGCICRGVPATPFSIASLSDRLNANTLRCNVL